MNEYEYFPSGTQEPVELERQRPRSVRWAFGFLAFGLALAVLLAVLLRIVLPGRVSWGSGVLLGNGYVLTCEHVIEEGRSYTVHWEGNTYKAQLVEASRSQDLALLEVDGLEAEGLSWTRGRSLGPGDVVVAVGYPAGQPQALSVSGEVLRVGEQVRTPGDVELRDVVLVYGAYEGGMSGAPLVNMWGELVGLVSGTLSGGETGRVGLAVSATSARRWLARVAPDIVLPEDQAGERLSLAQAADVARESVVRVEVPLHPLEGRSTVP